MNTDLSSLSIYNFNYNESIDAVKYSFHQTISNNQKWKPFFIFFSGQENYIAVESNFVSGEQETLIATSEITQLFSSSKEITTLLAAYDMIIDGVDNLSIYILSIETAHRYTISYEIVNGSINWLNDSLNEIDITNETFDRSLLNILYANVHNNLLNVYDTSDIMTYLSTKEHKIALFSNKIKPYLNLTKK